MFDDQERAVLRYAKEATETGVVSDATWGALRRHFDTRQAMEVVLTVAWYNCVVRILLPLQIEHEPGFKRKLKHREEAMEGADVMARRA